MEQRTQANSVKIVAHKSLRQKDLGNALAGQRTQESSAKIAEHLNLRVENGHALAEQKTRASSVKIAESPERKAVRREAMANAIQEYKCPCCGGAINFDSSIQKMKCPYCDTEFEMDALKAQDETSLANGGDDISWQKQDGGYMSEDETNGMKVYVCKSCGGEIVCDDTCSATQCPYCDNPVVLSGNVSGMLKPDIIIPFKLDKKAAKEGFYNHLKDKKLLPKVFKTQAHIDEIKGVYVPYWLFDADVEGNVSYRATRISHWSDSKYEYTKTSFYSVFRGGSVKFNDVPVDGSKKMPDELSESVEPFNLSEGKEFNSGYLAGYMSDKYDVESDQSFERASVRIKKSTEDVFASTVHGYMTVTPESSSVRTSNGKAKYALLPVWLLTTKWQKQIYNFAMNGQTGKFVGNLPIDKGAFWKYWAIYAACFSAVAIAVISLLGLV